MEVFKFDKSKVAALCASLPKGSMVQLVGDHGVYIMSFADKSMPKRNVIYAQGCDPNEDSSSFHDMKDDLYGGDDGYDDIGTSESLLKICNASSKFIVVKLTATKISISSDG